MFSTLENEPYAQEIVRQDTTACGKNITQREMYSVEIILLRENLRQVHAEYFKGTNLNGRAKRTSHDKKEYLFLLQ